LGKAGLVLISGQPIPANEKIQRHHYLRSINMSVVAAELANLPGVIAAGEYSYRGDRFSCKGRITDEMARMASIMCRATTMSEHMQVGLLEHHCPECGSTPPQGWIVRGPSFTVCNIANVFCFIDNRQASLNSVVALMRKRLAGATHDLV
jgi:roadblock/LC7 domain-containing protein